jgi:hypothetical protein
MRECSSSDSIVNLRRTSAISRRGRQILFLHSMVKLEPQFSDSFLAGLVGNLVRNFAPGSHDRDYKEEKRPGDAHPRSIAGTMLAV